MNGGDSVDLGGASAVAVVTDGDGSLNDIPVKRGDRLLVSGEATLHANDAALSAVVCFRRANEKSRLLM